MKKMKKRILVGSLLFVLVVLLVGGVSQYAFASRMMGAGPWGGMSRGHDRGDSAFKAELLRALNPMDFTEEQWKKFDEILGGLRDQGKDFRRGMMKEMWNTRKEIHAMMTAEGFDEEKAKEMIAAVRPSFVSMAQEVLKARNELYGILNDAQRNKVGAVLDVIGKRLEQPFSGPRELHAAMTRRLELTPDQKGKVEAITKETAPKMHAFAKTLFDQVKSEHAALANGPMSDEQLAESAGKIADLAEGALMEMGRVRAQVWETLTPEQREEMGKMRHPMGGMERRPGRMRK